MCAEAAKGDSIRREGGLFERCGVCVCMSERMCMCVCIEAVKDDSI